MAIWRIPIELSWPGAGSPGANVWHARTQSNVGDLQSALNALHVFYDALSHENPGVPPVLRPGVQVNLGAVVDVETQEGHDGTFPTIVAHGDGAAAPPANQIVVGWRTSIRARRGSGRTFLGPLNSLTIATDGTPTAAVRNMVFGTATTLISTSLSDNGWAFGVYGKSVAGGDRHSPRVLRDFTTAAVKNQFAVLRSRRD